MNQENPNNSRKAVVALTRGYTKLEGYDTLIERNNKLEEHLKEKVDVLIFHEGESEVHAVGTDYGQAAGDGGIPPDHQQYIQSKTGLKLSFIEVPFKKREEGMTLNPRSRPHINGWGYRCMCSFWFVDFWSYVEAYDFIIRVDEDCVMNSSLDDIFDRLEKENKVALYGRWVNDRGCVTQGLSQFASEKTESGRETKKTPSGPYTNVIALNLKRLRSNDKLFNYIRELKQSNNIYINRWGDLPLWGEVLHHLYDNEDHELTKLIKYYHGSHRYTIR
jgi:hypothetical protein